MTLRFLRNARRTMFGGRGTARERPSWRRPRPVEPPACPPGWQTGPPDFIGVGSQKCGTSWWFSMLNAHPEVQPQERKELRILLGFRGGMTAADVAEYGRWFPRPHGRKTGEWTPSYMTVSWMGRVISQAGPDARVLAIVRDPVERYRSGLPQWRRFHGGDGDDGAKDEQAAERQALRRGFYGRQVSDLVAALGQERILVLQYERCARDPRVEFARTLQFLGLSAWDPSDEILGQRPAASPVREELSQERRQELVSRYSPDVKILHGLVPDLDLSLWPNFGHLATA